MVPLNQLVDKLVLRDVVVRNGQMLQARVFLETAVEKAQMFLEIYQVDE